MLQPLTNIKRAKLSEISLFDDMLNKSTALSAEAGMRLLGLAKDYGIAPKDYLNLAIETDGDMSGFEQVLAKLNLPVRESLKDGIVLQAAAETFQTYSGTRALFPEVIDEVVRWRNRQDQFETLAPMIAGSRTVGGIEMVSTIVEDDSADRGTYTIAEGGRIPVRSIRSSEQAVKFYKHGSGIRTTYEFARRASIDMVVPFLARVQRELERSKVTHATNLLVNGDGINAAATEVDQSTYNTATGVTAIANQISWPHFLYWLVQRARAGAPVDTVIMNWDGWFQYQMLFARPTVLANAVNQTGAEALGKAGVSMEQHAVSLALRVKPVISSAVPANKMIGITVAETIEELVEANSRIEESERAIQNQTITVYRTENSGFRILWADTRSVYDFGN